MVILSCVKLNALNVEMFLKAKRHGGVCHECVVLEKRKKEF